MTRPCCASRASGRGTAVQFVDREGLLVPVRDTQGRVVALKLRRRRRRRRAEVHLDLQLRPREAPPRLPPHVPLGTPAQAESVRLTEGELKADIAFALSGLPTIGVSGVDQWRVALPILEAMGAKVVHVAFDMDARTKPGVAAALSRLRQGLIRLKYEVRLETWDPADGKGIDDLLAAGKQPTVVTGQEVLARIEDDRPVGRGPSPTTMARRLVPTGPGRGRSPRSRSNACRRPSSSSRPRPPGALQCPVDFLGMAMLAVASAAIGDSRRLRIRAGYEEAPDLCGHRRQGRGGQVAGAASWSAAPSTSSRSG